MPGALVRLTGSLSRLRFFHLEPSICLSASYFPSNLYTLLRIFKRLSLLMKLKLKMMDLGALIRFLAPLLLMPLFKST
jgi:hypothetical protein